MSPTTVTAASLEVSDSRVFTIEIVCALYRCDGQPSLRDRGDTHTHARTHARETAKTQASRSASTHAVRQSRSGFVAALFIERHCGSRSDAHQRVLKVSERAFACMWLVAVWLPGEKRFSLAQDACNIIGVDEARPAA